jgi:DNA-binding FrmR family transcriptional regulator
MYLPMTRRRMGQLQGIMNMIEDTMDFQTRMLG